jgi:MinD-like ATPase involved in chromosome partitioning or flagellar assembly
MFTLKGLSNAEVEQVRPLLQIREVAKNEVVFVAGTEALATAFVDSGALKLVERKAQDGGDDMMVSIAKTGSFCGEESLLSDESRYLYTSVAIEPTILRILDREGMQRLMAKSMSIGTKILLGISRNYREAIAVPEHQAKVLVFYSPKEGTGSTTLAVNTAMKLAQTGKSTVLVDADFQFGNAHVLLGLKPAPNVARMVQIEQHLLYNRITPYLHKVGDLNVLLATDLPQEAEIITRASMNQILRELMKNHEYVVVDCQSYINDLTLLMWDFADQLFLVTNPELGSVTRLHQLFKVLQRLDFNSEKLMCLLNKMESTSDEAKAFFNELKKLKHSGLFQIERDRIAAEKALLKAEPLFQSFPESPLVRDLSAFWDHLLGKTRKNTERGGIFSRLKSLFVQP